MINITLPPLEGRNSMLTNKPLTTHWASHIKSEIRACIGFATLALAAAPTASATTYVSGPVATDATWTLANSPYVVTHDVTVNPGATLTIEPRVIVKFNARKGLTVQGRILANGASNGRIVFTSINDDSVGGDTGGDGASAGAKGDWRGITLSTSASGADSAMSFVDIAYAGQYYAAVFAFNSASNLSLVNSTVSHSLFHGIALQSKTAATKGFVLAMDSSSVADSGWLGLVISDKAAIVTDSSFTGSGFEGTKIGLSPSFTGSGSRITGSTVSGNRKVGIALYVDPYLTSSQKPSGQLNNIHANNFLGAPYSHFGLQLTSHKQHDDADWSDNYWGENTASKPCDPRYQLLRRHQVIYADVTFTSPVSASSTALPIALIQACTRDTVFTENPALTPFGGAPPE